jgi:putative tricarboxylic transport membrane protein
VKRAAVAWLFFFLIALGSLYEALKLPFGRTNAPGAGFFPAVLAALLAVVSLIGLIAAFRDASEQKISEPRLVWKKIILTVTALLAFAFIFEYVGYLVTTFLFVAFLLRIVERKSWAQTGAVALSASLVSYIIFGLLLGAPLPAGFLLI